MDEDSGMESREGTNLMNEVKDALGARERARERWTWTRTRWNNRREFCACDARSDDRAGASATPRQHDVPNLGQTSVGGKEPLGIFLSRDWSWRGAGKYFQYFQVGKYFRGERLTDASDALDGCAGGPVCGGANTIFFIYRGNKDKPLIKYSLHEQIVRRAH